jgi:hypothetical protein
VSPSADCAGIAGIPSSFGIGRFEVSEIPGGIEIFDRLTRRRGRGRHGAHPLDSLREAFRAGVVPARLEPWPTPVAASSQQSDVFWQFPCITERAAYDLHHDAEAAARGDELQCYVGLPWATYLDRQRVDATQAAFNTNVACTRSRIVGLARTLRELGIRLRVHTVCQHIYWERLVPLWRSIGITDVWLSHATQQWVASGSEGLIIHPWRLYAVNVEDEARRVGLKIGKPAVDRSLLASFIGTHMPHYLTDLRRRLRSLQNEPGFLVEVTEDQWHFEGVVYDHQVQGASVGDAYRIDSSVERYNAILSDSRFALCPAGAGPNTLRLWEALAVGAVPVILGPAPAMPEGGTLAFVDWERIVLVVEGDEIGELPAILRSMAPDAVARRQAAGMDAFRMIQAQRCF